MGYFIIVGLFLALLFYFVSIIIGNDSKQLYTVKINKRYYNDSQRKDYDDSPPPVEKYWEHIEWLPVKATLQIAYTDAENKKSRRVIRINGYDGSPYIKCFCTLRDDRRTFRVDRITEAVDVETGVVIDDIPEYLLKKYKNSPGYILPKLFCDYIEVIKVFVYVGKADGQLRAEERNIICTSIRSLAKGSSITNDDINKYINKLPLISIQAFKLAFGKICRKYPKQTPKIYEICKKIVYTQKIIKQTEEEALEYMCKKMSKVGIKFDK